MEDKNLKLYFFDRVPPASYVEILVGILITAVPMTIFMLNKDALSTGSHGSLSDFGILILIVASFLSLFGLIIMFAGFGKISQTKHGFLAERDGHIYFFSLSSDRLKETRITSGVGNISKIINAVSYISAVSGYNKQMDKEKESAQIYSDVNKWLDDNYSYLYSIRDLNSNEYTKVERAIYLNEYKRLKGCRE